MTVHTAGLRETRWYEFLLRFVLGGLVTAGAAIISDRVSISFGGLFLAFPAILAASLTLIAKHEREGKEEKRQEGTVRGKKAAGADAAGAVMGSLGLGLFAVVIWRFIEKHNVVWVIACATVVWALASVVLWLGWKEVGPRVWRRLLQR